jgi:ACT domain-containing protein
MAKAKRSKRTHDQVMRDVKKIKLHLAANPKAKINYVLKKAKMNYALWSKYKDEVFPEKKNFVSYSEFQAAEDSKEEIKKIFSSVSSSISKMIEVHENLGMDTHFSLNDVITLLGHTESKIILYLETK